MGPIFRRIAAIPHHGPDRPPVARDPTQIHPGGLPVPGERRRQGGIIGVPGWRRNSSQPARPPVFILAEREFTVHNEGSHAIGRHPATAGRKTDSPLYDPPPPRRQNPCRPPPAVAFVVARAVEVLGSRPRALAWLRTPAGGLGGTTPLEGMTAAEGGAPEVRRAS